MAFIKQIISEQHQHQPGNLYDCSTSDLSTKINDDRDARNVIIARHQEHDDLEAYSLTVTPDLQGHKPSNHICARIKSCIYTTELSRYHNTYHEIKAYKL
jgi:hypothetical protein